MTIDEVIQEALSNKVAIVAYQTKEGIHIGFIDAEAVHEVQSRTDSEGYAHYASAIVCAEGGDIQKAQNPLGSILQSLKSTWVFSKDFFLSTEEIEEDLEGEEGIDA